MPEIHVERHGDRWAVKEGPDATPIFESYTREEAESEARRRADGGPVVVADDPQGEEGKGQHPVGSERDPEPHDARSGATPGDRGEVMRERQGGL